MKRLSLIRYKHKTTGGAQNYLNRLYEALKKDSNYECDILSISKDELKPSLFTPSFLKPLLFSNKLCRAEKNSIYFSLERVACPDIYRAGDGVHKEWMQIKHSKKRTITKPKDLIYLYLEQRCFNNAKKIVANSEMIKKSIIDFYNIPSSKIEVVYNGFDAKEFDKEDAKKKLKKDLGLENGTKIILFVGNGFFRKGVKELIELVSQLKYQNIVTVIIGKDKEIQKYKNLANSSGKKFLFLGEQKEVERYYQGSDIFVFPTLYEPFSNATLEAMAYECVSFTTLKNGAYEIIDESFFRLEDDLDVSAIRIDALLNDETKLKEYQQLHAKKAKNLSIQVNLQKTLDVINSI
ncbi:MAG: glycosyltransferase family 4 protein [Campylobacterales bacterium]